MKFKNEVGNDGYGLKSRLVADGLKEKVINVINVKVFLEYKKLHMNTVVIFFVQSISINNKSSRVSYCLEHNNLTHRLTYFLFLFI